MARSYDISTQSNAAVAPSVPAGTVSALNGVGTTTSDNNVAANIGAVVTGGGQDGVSASYDATNRVVDLTNTDKGTVAVAAHVALADPHAQYQLEANLPEDVQDIVGGFIVPGTGATAVYNDVANTLTIGVHANLQAIAGLTTAADRLSYWTGAGAAALATFTSFARTLVDDADAAAARTTLGLGTMATEAAANYIPQPATPTTGYVLTWNGTAWVGAAPAGGGVTDHGALSGLGDDDHAQYVLADGTRLIAAGQVVGTAHATATTYSPILSVVGTAANEPLQINSFAPNIVFLDRSSSAYNVRLLTNNATVEWSSDTSAAAGAWTTGQSWNLLTGTATISGTAPILTLNQPSGANLVFDASGTAVTSVSAQATSGYNSTLDFNANAGDAGGTGYFRVNRSASNSTGGSGLRIHSPGTTALWHWFQHDTARIGNGGQPTSFGGLVSIDATGTSGLTASTVADDLVIDSSGSSAGMSFLNASGSGSAFIMFGNSTSPTRGRIFYSWAGDYLGLGATGVSNVLQIAGSGVTFNADPAGNIVSGTWSPTVTATSGFTSPGTKTCRYSRVGNVVHVSGRVTGTSSATSAGAVIRAEISIPIAAASMSADSAGGSASLRITGSSSIGGEAFGSGSNISLYFLSPGTSAGAALSFAFAVSYVIA